MTLARETASARVIMTLLSSTAVLVGSGLVVMLCVASSPSFEHYVVAALGAAIAMLGFYAACTREHIELDADGARCVTTTLVWRRVRPLPPIVRVCVEGARVRLETTKGAWHVVGDAPRIAEFLGL